MTMFKNCEFPNLRDNKENDFYKELKSKIELKLGSLSKGIQIEFREVRRSSILTHYCECSIYHSFDCSSQMFEELQSIIGDKLWDLANIECSFKYYRTFN